MLYACALIIKSKSHLKNVAYIEHYIDVGSDIHFLKTLSLRIAPRITIQKPSLFPCVLP
jgi:hypothetical protein